MCIGLGRATQPFDNRYNQPGMALGAEVTPGMAQIELRRVAVTSGHVYSLTAGWVALIHEHRTLLFTPRIRAERTSPPNGRQALEVLGRS